MRISVDGKGRWTDNVIVEPLWRSLKHECVYLQVFEGGTAARKAIRDWFIAERVRGNWQLDRNSAKLNPAAGCPKGWGTISGA